MNRSYVKTRNLEDLAARDPKLAEQVEALCRAVKAAQGFLMQSGAVSVLRFSNDALSPFIESKNDDAAVESVAALFSTVRTEKLKTGPKTKKVGGGVRFNASRRGPNKWQADIRRDGERIYLGCFATEDEARNVYEAAVFRSG